MLATVKLFFLKCNLSPPPSKLVEDKLVLMLLIYYYTSMSHFNLLWSSSWCSARLACLQRWKKQGTGTTDSFLALPLSLSLLFLISVFWVSFPVLFISFSPPPNTGTVHGSAHEFGNLSQLRLYITVVRRCCCSEALYVGFLFLKFS